MPDKAKQFMPRDECLVHRLEDARWKANMTDRMYDVQMIVRKQAGMKPPKKPKKNYPSITIPVPGSSRDIHIDMTDKASVIMTLTIAGAIIFILITTYLC